MPPTAYPADRGSGANDADATTAGGSRKEKLLKRLLHRFDIMTEARRPMRDRGDLSMRAIGDTGPWTPEEMLARDALLRPYLHLDQLSQYSNNLINEYLQNPFAVKVDPADEGATEKSAELMANRIRQVEYENNAIQAYTKAYEDCVQRGYGVFGMTSEEIAFDSFDQRVKIIRFPDPDMVLWDPDCTMADCSDMEDATVLEWLHREDFIRKWPEAEVTSFSADHVQRFGSWFNGDNVLTAAYWYIEKKQRYLYLLNDGSPKGLKMFRDELPKGYDSRNGRLAIPDGPNLEILNEKKAVEKKVMRCVATCAEILEETKWTGRHIPIFPVLGKERYVRNKNGQTQKVYDSYIWKGIDGQRLFNSLCTNELESVNRIPKDTYRGYEGQFDTSTDWANVNKIPTAYTEVKATTAETGAQLLPLPEISYYVPVDLEAQKESARRSIQASLGSYGFTKQDDNSVKSGKLANILKQNSDMGSFHFPTSLKVTMAHAGRCYGEVIAEIEDTARTVGTRAPDGTHKLIRINEPIKNEKTGQVEENRYSKALHDYTVSTGPSYESQRAAAQDELAALRAGPMYPMVVDLDIKQMQLGPLGEQMADRLTPPQFAAKDGQEPLPPQAVAAMQQKDHDLQAMHKLVQELQAKNIELEDAANANKLDLQVKAEIASIDDETKRYQIDKQAETAIAVAEIAQRGKVMDAKVKLATTHEQLTSAENLHASTLGHEAQQADQQQAHEGDLASQAQQHEGSMASQQQGHDSMIHKSQIDADRAMADKQIEELDGGATHRFNPASGSIDEIGANAEESPEPDATHVFNPKSGSIEPVMQHA